MREANPNSGAGVLYHNQPSTSHLIIAPVEYIKWPCSPVTATLCHSSHSPLATAMLSKATKIKTVAETAVPTEPPQALRLSPLSPSRALRRTGGCVSAREAEKESDESTYQV